MAGDDTVFVIEQNGIEAFRLNQKVHEVNTSYTPGAISASGTLVAVGDVGYLLVVVIQILLTIAKDRNVRLYDWDGKTLKAAGTLEGNTGTISALSFSLDGNLIASGDVSFPLRTRHQLLIRMPNS